MAKKEKGAGTRKYDRNRDFCKAYANSLKHEQSHARRVWKHLQRHPADATAVHYWNNLSPAARQRAGFSIESVAPKKSPAKRIPPRFYGPAMGGDERAKEAA